jgi:hypothetical protein
MSGFQKMIAMPMESENNDENIEESTDIMNSNTVSTKNQRAKVKRINTFLDKLNKIMKIFLKLANIRAYDVIGRVRDRKGNYINDSDIIALINHAMSHGKLLLAQNEFIRLLHEAKIEPELIINENIKAKLLNLYSNKSESLDELNEIPATPIVKTPEKPIVNSRPIREVKKRIHIQTEENDSANEIFDSDTSEPVRKRKRTWEVLDNGEEEESENIDKEIDNWDFNPHNK